MAKEIERKFLVKGGDWKKGTVGVLCRQGYLSIDPERTVRVRCMEGKGFLTIKGAGQGIVRPEFEYLIPAGDAEIMLEEICLKPLIVKRRYRIPFGGHIFEVDEFLAENEGLVVAEVELNDENDRVELPAWIGEEVSNDPRYFNASLLGGPFCDWPVGRR